MASFGVVSAVVGDRVAWKITTTCGAGSAEQAAAQLQRWVPSLRDLREVEEICDEVGFGCPSCRLIYQAGANGEVHVHHGGEEELDQADLEEGRQAFPDPEQHPKIDGPDAIALIVDGVFLFGPPDVDQAYSAWGANCGPAALAALLGCEVAKVRPLLGDDWPGYTNPTHLRKALAAAGWQVSKRTFADHREVIETGSAGLAHVQFSGPWEAGGARAAYRHTHWISYRVTGDGLMVFDINAVELPGNGWLPVAEWDEGVAPQLYPKKCTGHYVRLWMEAFPQ